jgi:ferritin-like metal-binding protein YciE
MSLDSLQKLFVEELLTEGKEVMGEDGEPAVLDAALMATTQRVEHYEIAAYGCLRTYAQLLGYSEAADLLQETLDEEEKADQTLTTVGEQGINTAAAAVGAEEDDEES